MEVVFNLGYLCCSCNRRPTKKNTAFTYRDSCICKDCFKKIEAYPKLYRFEASDNVEYMTPILKYKGVYRDMFLDFKFMGKRACGHIIGQILAYYLKDCDLFGEFDYIVPIPVSKKRWNIRGYNQSEIMARYVSEALKIPIKNALVRDKDSAPQSKVGRRKRKENVKDAFSAAGMFNGENVILFDDVYTTGNTATNCAKVLKDRGAGVVCIIAAAHNDIEDMDVTIHLFHE